MYQRKDGDGSLFQNNKQKDTHPDYRGEVQLNGQTYEIAGWKKATREGKPWLSLRVQPKRAPLQKVAEGRRAEKFEDDNASDIPF